VQKTALLPLLVVLLAGACQSADGDGRPEQALVLQCAVSVTFDADSSKLTAKARRELDMFITGCAPGLSDKAATLVIEGHANRTGAAERNATLSEQRMASVQAYLFATQVSAAKVELGTYGDTRSSNASGERRVSVYVKWD
jgi:outer membrane protein OmpA-like peptidoglycan-associated protein